MRKNNRINGQKRPSLVTIRIIICQPGKKTKVRTIRKWAGKEKPTGDNHNTPHMLFTEKGVDHILQEVSDKLEKELPELDFRLVELGVGEFNLIGEVRHEGNAEGDEQRRGDGVSVSDSLNGVEGRNHDDEHQHRDDREDQEGLEQRRASSFA